jgi:hypothetical protein
MQRELNESDISNIVSLIQTIRKETIPTTGHTDPESIQDCWQEVEEVVSLLVDKCKLYDKLKEDIEGSIKLRTKELDYFKQKSEVEAVRRTTTVLSCYRSVLEAMLPPSPFNVLPESVTIEGSYVKREVFVNGQLLDPRASLAVSNHSPDGFNWGFVGSGPAQLALGILMCFMKPSVASQYYQTFKFGWIAGLPKTDFIKTINLRQLMKELVEKPAEQKPDGIL